MDWWRSSWTQFFCFVFLLVDSKLYSRKSLYGYQYWTCRPEKPHNWQTSLHWTSLDLQFFTSMASLLFFSIYHNLPLPVVAVCPKINCSKISPCWLKKKHLSCYCRSQVLSQYARSWDGSFQNHPAVVFGGPLRGKHEDYSPLTKWNDPPSTGHFRNFRNIMIYVLRLDEDIATTYNWGDASCWDFSFLQLRAAKIWDERMMGRYGSTQWRVFHVKRNVEQNCASKDTLPHRNRVQSMYSRLIGLIRRSLPS